jgi:hypothetical protein
MAQGFVNKQTMVASDQSGETHRRGGQGTGEELHPRANLCLYLHRLDHGHGGCERSKGLQLLAAPPASYVITLTWAPVSRPTNLQSADSGITLDFATGFVAVP